MGKLAPKPKWFFHCFESTIFISEDNLVSPIPEELTPKAEALEQYLESELGVDVELVIPTNYEAIIEGMRFGHIDGAFMDTGPAWITHERTGAEAVLAELVKGKVNYQATVWTLAENDSLQSIEDTVGKKVAFTSMTGSSGFVRPMGTLVTEGHVAIEGDELERGR